MIRPASTSVTLGFGMQPGYTLNNGFHKGTDFSHSPNNVIYAPEPGVVKLYPNNGNDGNAIYMTVGNRKHAFCHLSKFLVTDGQAVKQGQAIGIMGDTGAAQGVHLHWAVRVDDNLVNPLTLVEEEDMQEIEKWKGVSDDRLKVIKQIATKVSVDYQSENDLPQVLANIGTLYGLVNAKDGTITELVKNASSDEELGRKVRELLTKGNV